MFIVKYIYVYTTLTPYTQLCPLQHESLLLKTCYNQWLEIPWVLFLQRSQNVAVEGKYATDSLRFDLFSHTPFTRMCGAKKWLHFQCQNQGKLSTSHSYRSQSLRIQSYVKPERHHSVSGEDQMLKKQLPGAARNLMQQDTWSLDNESKK